MCLLFLIGKMFTIVLVSLAKNKNKEMDISL